MKRTALALTALLVACGGDSTSTEPSARLEGIVVSPVADPLPAIGSTVALTATGRYADGSEKALTSVSWSSSASDVAGVDNAGRVTAAGNGQASISASQDGVQGSTTVRVEQVLDRMEVSAPGDTVHSLGIRARFQAVLVDANGYALPEPEPGSLSWTSDDGSVASVDDQGRVTPLAAGTVLVSAESGDLTAARSLVVVDRVPVTIDLATAEALQWFLEDSIAAWGIEGGLAAVSFPNGEVWAGAAGEGRVGQQMSTALEGHFWSVSKTLVAATIHQMADEGLLAYTDTIGALLPAQENIPPGITVEELLGHRSGLFDYLNDIPNLTSLRDALYSDHSRVWTLEEVIDTFLGPPTGSPGDPVSYSNTNYIVLAQIVEAISGRRFHEEVRVRLQDRLGLDDTHFPPWEEGSRQRVTRFTADGLPTPWPSNPSFESYIGPAGGMVSTVSDMASWGRQLFAGNVVSPSAQARLRLLEPLGGPTPDVVDAEWLGVGQGAFTGRVRDHTFVSHTGGFNESVTAVLYSDDLDLSVSLLFNSPGTAESTGFRLTAMLLDVAAGVMRPPRSDLLVGGDLGLADGAR